ncbi:hypothetical protein HDU79_000943 [Rhizoclosmatium sp. JEL0117]|nr:hypothetical protein HDU79_000943 [Rhizoclosmatium sp. JEL0117]
MSALLDGGDQPQQLVKDERRRPPPRNNRRGGDDLPHKDRSENLSSIGRTGVDDGGVKRNGSQTRRDDGDQRDPLASAPASVTRNNSGRDRPPRGESNGNNRMSLLGRDNPQRAASPLFPGGGPDNELTAGDSPSNQTPLEQPQSEKRRPRPPRITQQQPPLPKPDETEDDLTPINKSPNSGSGNRRPPPNRPPVPPQSTVQFANAIDWDDDTDDEGDTFRLGKGAAIKNIRSSHAAVAAHQNQDERSESPTRAAGRSLKQKTQSVLKVNHPPQSIGLDGRPLADADDDDDDAATEEMDDMDYIDSLGKMAMVPPRAFKPPNSSASSVNNVPITPTTGPEIPADVAAELEALQLALAKEKAESERLRQIMSLNNGELGPILDLLTQKESQLEILKEAVLTAKVAVDETRAERDDALDTVALVKSQMRDAVEAMEADLDLVLKDKEALEKGLQESREATAKIEKELQLRVQERDDAEMELDTIMEERNKSLKELDDKTRGLSQAENSISRLQKEIEMLKLREVESSRRLMDAESRLQTAEIALEKAEMDASFAVNEVRSKGEVATEIEQRLKVAMTDLHFAKSKENELERAVRDAEMRLKFAEEALMESEMACENAFIEINGMKNNAAGADKALRSEITALQNELDNVMRTLVTKNGEVEEAHDTIGDLDIRVNELEADLADARTALENNSKTVEIVTQDVIKARNESNLLKQQIESLKKTHDAELRRVFEQKAGDQKGMESLLAERAEHTKRVADLEAILAEVENERDDLLGRCEEMERDLDEIMRENAEKVEALEATLQEVGGETGERLEQLHHELNIAKNALEVSQNKIAELERSKQEQIALAESQIKELEEEIEQTTFECEELNEKVGRLEADLESSIQLEVTLREQVKKLEESIGGNQANKGDLEVIVGDLEKQLEEAWVERDELFDRAQALEEQLKKTVEAGAVEKSFGADEEAVNAARAEVEALKSELERVRAQKSEFTGTANELEEELLKVSEERDKALSELDAVKNELQELEQMFEDAQAEVEELKTQAQQQNSKEEMAKLEQELNDALDEIDELNAQLRNLTESSDNVKELADAQKALAEANKEIADLKAKLQAGGDSANAVTISDNSAKIEELEFLLEDAKFETEELNAKLDEANATIDELEKLLDDEKAQADELDAANKSLTDEIVALEEKLARQQELSNVDGDTKAIIESFENDIAKLKTELEVQKKICADLEEQFNESENVNKELNNSLDAADQEIETLNKELDEMFEENQKLSAGCGGGGGAELAEANAKLEALQKELDLKNGELDVAVEARLKDKMDEMLDLEDELRARIEELEEQEKEGRRELVQQLQDQELDAKEMRESLMERLRSQDLEATTLRDELTKLKSDFTDSTGKLKATQTELEEFRLRTQGLEKRYFERMNLLEDLYDQASAEVESLRAKLVDALTSQGQEAPIFKSLPQLPPANFEPPLSGSPTPAEKKTFLSSVFGSRGKTPTPEKPASGAGDANQQQSVSGGKGTQDDADSKSLKNKASTGILRSLWGGGGGSKSSTDLASAAVGPPTSGLATHATTLGTSSKRVSITSVASAFAKRLSGGSFSSNAVPGRSITVSPAPSVMSLVDGADDEDLPKDKPSTLLASIWGAKSNLKRTNSETQMKE